MQDAYKQFHSFDNSNSFRYSYHPANFHLIIAVAEAFIKWRELQFAPEEDILKAIELTIMGFTGPETLIITTMPV